MFRCKDLLILPSMAKARPLAGKEGMNNLIRWVYKPEDMNFSKWVHGNELLIVSLPVIKNPHFNLYRLLEKAISLHMSGIRIKKNSVKMAGTDQSCRFRILPFQMVQKHPSFYLHMLPARGTIIPLRLKTICTVIQIIRSQHVTIHNPEHFPNVLLIAENRKRIA